MKRSLAFTSRLRPFLVLIHPLLASSVEAQYSASPPPAAYALREVTVVSPGGEIRSGMTVIVRKGLIEAIAAGADIPPDAIVLEGSPLFLYPGMIDGDGRAAFELPEPDENAPPPVAWDPPRAAQGFTPHRRLVDYLTATPDSIRELRRKGIVALVAHPWGGLAPGRSALLVPREDAETPWGLVANPELGLAMAFRGARGVYPGSLFAVIAFLRQSFEDAKREGAILAEYEKDSWGMTLPRWDPDYRVLRGVAAVQRPVFFAAERAEDIRRVLALAEEVGFAAVVVGGGEAWRVAEELKARGMAVLVSLDFPEPEEWKPAREDEGGGGEEGEPLDPAAVREKERLENLYANAGRLAAAGVAFALTSGGGGAELRAGARKAIEYGLSEEGALRALTTTPATLFGVPELALLEAGRAANFVVTDGPIFAKETRVLYTFVEGWMEKGPEEKDEGEEKEGEEAPGRGDRPGREDLPDGESRAAGRAR